MAEPNRYTRAARAAMDKKQEGLEKDAPEERVEYSSTKDFYEQNPRYTIQGSAPQRDRTLMDATGLSTLGGPPAAAAYLGAKKLGLVDDKPGTRSASVNLPASVREGPYVPMSAGEQWARTQSNVEGAEQLEETPASAAERDFPGPSYEEALRMKEEIDEIMEEMRPERESQKQELLRQRIKERTGSDVVSGALSTYMSNAPAFRLGDYTVGPPGATGGLSEVEKAQLYEDAGVEWKRRKKLRSDEMEDTPTDILEEEEEEEELPAHLDPARRHTTF